MAFCDDLGPLPEGLPMAARRQRRWSAWWATWVAAGVAVEVAALFRGCGRTFSTQVRAVLASLEQAGPLGRAVRWLLSALIAGFFLWVIPHFTRPF